LARSLRQTTGFSEVRGELIPFLYLHRKIPVVPDRHFEEQWNMLQCFITTYFGV